MTAPELTEAELAAIEARAARHAKMGAHATLPHADALRLIAALRRRMALPVIETCGHCALHSDNYGSRPGCHHRDAPRPEASAADSDLPPPSWCPLRSSGELT